MDLSATGPTKKRSREVDAPVSLLEDYHTPDDSTEPHAPPAKRARHTNVVVTGRTELERHMPEQANADDRNLLCQVITMALVIADTQRRPAPGSGIDPSDIDPTPRIHVDDRVHMATDGYYAIRIIFPHTMLTRVASRATRS
jgi:hypothetical protein